MTMSLSVTRSTVGITSRRRRICRLCRCRFSRVEVAEPSSADSPAARRVRVLVRVGAATGVALPVRAFGRDVDASPSAAEVESPPFEPSAEADVERRRPRPPRRRRRRVEPVEPSVGASPGSFWSIVAAGSDVSAFVLFVVLAVRRRRGDVAAFGVPASPSLWVSVSDPSSGDAVAVVERLRPPRPRPPRRPRRERDRGFVAASPSLVGSTIVSLFARSTSPVCASRSISASAGSVLDDARVEAPFAEPPLDPPRPPRPRPRGGSGGGALAARRGIGLRGRDRLDRSRSGFVRHALSFRWSRGGETGSTRGSAWAA
jgi:hypothetical protein